MKKRLALLTRIFYLAIVGFTFCSCWTLHQEEDPVEYWLASGEGDRTLKVGDEYLFSFDIGEIPKNIGLISPTEATIIVTSGDPSIIEVGEISPKTPAKKNCEVLLTAKAPGIVELTFDLANKSRTKTYTITVVENNISVTGIGLDKTTASITVGATEQLTATVAPADATNKAVNWSSSAPTIATVSEAGLVTAITAGNASITATTADGNKTASCSVTVTSATIAVTGVTLDKTMTTILAGSPEQLTATVTPANATNKAVTWSSSAPTIATVSATGLVTAITAGNASITATTVDGNKTASCSVIAKSTVAQSAITSVLPNPFSAGNGGVMTIIGTDFLAYGNVVSIASKTSSPVTVNLTSYITSETSTQIKLNIPAWTISTIDAHTVTVKSGTVSATKDITVSSF